MKDRYKTICKHPLPIYLTSCLDKQTDIDLVDSSDVKPTKYAKYRVAKRNVRSVNTTVLQRVTSGAGGPVAHGIKTRPVNRRSCSCLSLAKDRDSCQGNGRVKRVISV